MSKKSKNLNDCRTFKDLREFCNTHGLPILRVSGGQEIHGNQKGSLPLSTHAKEIDKGLLHGIKKQITRLLILCAFLFMVRFIVTII